MKTTPKLQQFIEQLAVTYGLDLCAPDAYLCLERADDEPWERLVIQRVAPTSIRLSCRLYIFEEWVDEPAIVFWTAATGDWVPFEVDQIKSGRESYGVVDAEGQLGAMSDEAGQAALACFAEEEVFVNLAAREWLTHGQRVAETASGRFTGCQSDHPGRCYGYWWQCSICGKTVCCAEGTDNHPEVCDACWVQHYGHAKEVDHVPF